MTTILSPEVKEQCDLACYHLLRGDPVALPTETVYGLAAPIDQELALAKIFSLKNRPEFDPLIVHVSVGYDISTLVKNVTPLHAKLMERFWPGPLTLLFERSERVPDLCTAGTESVALRSPSNTYFQEILRRVDVPLAAPSANRFGRISPTSAADVVEELGAYGLEAVVDGGACRVGVESTVVKVLAENEIEILRLGALSVETLTEFLGPTVKISVSQIGSGMDANKVEAPGQLLSHYAPRTPLRIVNPEKLSSENFENKLLLVCDARELPYHFVSPPKTTYLTRQGSDLEAAANLFKSLRSLDQKGVSEILVLLGPEENLFRTVNERLRKAAH